MKGDRVELFYNVYCFVSVSPKSDDTKKVTALKIVMNKMKPIPPDTDIVRMLLKHGAKPQNVLPDYPHQSNEKASLMDKMCHRICTAPDKNLCISFIEHGIKRDDMSKIHIFTLMWRMQSFESAKLIEVLAMPSDLGKFNLQGDLTQEWVPRPSAADYRGLYLRVPGRHPAWVNNMTYLGWATILGHREAVKFLVDPKIGAVVPNEIEHTMCLIEASMRGRLDIILLLLSVDGTKKPDQAQLHRFGIAAAATGHFGVLIYWLKFGLKWSTLQETDMRGKHILAAAAVNNKNIIVKFLLRQSIILTRRALATVNLTSLSRGAQKMFKLIIRENNIAPNVGQHYSSADGNHQLCPELAAYLALYGFHIDTEHGLAINPVAWQRVKEIQNKAKMASLYNLCISRVRGCLGPNVSDKIKLLPLPKLIQGQLFRPDLQKLSFTNILNVDLEF